MFEKTARNHADDRLRTTNLSSLIFSLRPHYKHTRVSPSGVIFDWYLVNIVEPGLLPRMPADAGFFPLWAGLGLFGHDKVGPDTDGYSTDLD
jgi:hypothetical protein